MNSPSAKSCDDRWWREYQQLTGLMYALRRVCPRLLLLAVPIVHPRNPMPIEHLELLDAFVKSDPQALGLKGTHLAFSLSAMALIARQWVRCALAAAWCTLRVIYLRVMFGHLVRRMKREPAAVLMKTWSFGPESLQGEEDFYFGKLPRLLENHGVTSILLCGNVRAKNEVEFTRAVLKRRAIRCLPELILVPVWAPLVLALSQFTLTFVLRRLGRTAEDQKFALFCEKASLDCLRPQTTQNALQFYIAKIAVQIWGARIFVTLYEGQPWEKLAWHGVKAAHTGCITAGYQHTVIMRHSFSLTRPNTESWELSTPQIVLCLGEGTRKLLKSGHEANGTKLIVLGSFRRATTDVFTGRPRANKRTVLVIPEGVLPECKLLFNFVMRLAPRVPDHRFVLRCHPVLPFTEVRRHLEADPDRFANVEISNIPSILDDFARSSVVLYRGSSAVLYAVLDGLKPIYLRDADHFDIDPLFEIDCWREYVSSQEEMVDVLHRYSAAPDVVDASWRNARQYVDSYTVPVNEDSVKGFLMAAGLVREVHPA